MTAIARCIRCNRKLTRAPINGMGPRCAASMFGTKPRRPSRTEVIRTPDDAQADLFAEVRT